MIIIEKLNRLREWANSERPVDLLFIALNEVSAEMSNRIFNSEKGYRDIYGNAPKPTYSDPYKKVRENYKPARQTKVVDFELTGSLRRSLDTVRDANNIKIVLRNDAEALISKYLEKYRGTIVFEMSEDELKLFNQIASELLIKDIKKIFNETL